MDEHDELKIEEGDFEEEGSAEKKVTKMREELATCRKEKQEYMDGWQRAKADYVNLLKRLGKEKEAENVRGIVQAAETLLPAFDALERAKEHGEVPEGFAAIIKQLEGAFRELGLEALGEIGEPFNPAWHESIGQDVTENEAEDDILSAVLEKGWRIGETVIRPAKVRIARLQK